MNTETIKVMYQGIEPVMARKVRIGAFADKKSPVPIAMTDKIPENSRLLKALEMKYNKDHHLMANALSFGDYGKAGDGDV
jgi:hypothetical protein